MCRCFITIFLQEQLGSISPTELLYTGAPGAPCSVGFARQALYVPRIHCLVVLISAEVDGTVSYPGLIAGKDGETVPGLAGLQD